MSSKRVNRFLLSVGLLPASLLMIGGLPPALAQAIRQCPLTERGKDPGVPAVTAQQVDDGTSNLRDFILAVRGRAGASDEIAFACVIRQDNGLYLSDSTYLTRITPEGRNSLHGRDMSFSGRKLKPEIYQDILEALGIGPDVTDTLKALEAAGKNGNAGSFTVDGAEAYATVYLSPYLGSYVLTAGFDLTESHVISFEQEQETVDYGNPMTAAGDVVDRETLKAFVTEAGNYWIGRISEAPPESRGTLLTQMTLAIHDPTGPWQNGSVYLYAWNLASNIILLHGGFPNRYELLPLEPVAVDSATGRNVLDLLLEQVNSESGEGFAEFSFDDPNDPFDNVAIPKIGYVRTFMMSLADNDVPIVFGSGFYPR